MTGRLSLSQQLAAIRNDDAPAEYDPESTYFADPISGKRDLEAGRADYLDVGESRLRKNLESELDGRYAGVKSSRSQLYGMGEAFGTGEEESDDEEEDGEEGSSEDGDSLLDGEDEEDDEDEDIPSGEEEEDEELDSEDEQEEEQVRDSRKASAVSRKGESTSSKMEDDSRAMIQELKKASSAEVDKGRDVKRQLSFWDTLLEARIRLQKCVSSMNVMPEPGSISEYTSATPDDFTKTTSSLEELSELLFSVRRGLLSKNEKLELPPSLTKKRKRGSPEYLDSALDELESLSEHTTPYERTVISKWSDKVSAASGSSSSSTAKQENRFKALGTQNTLSQIDSILAQDMGRLIERTRVRRTGGGQQKGGVTKVVGRDGALEPVEGEKDISNQIFDDTDFYQSLLREVVDSNSSSSSSLPGMLGNAYSGIIGNVSRKKASIDPKASKGRKLRYHVHEKLQNFMAPIPVLTWEKEQTDELFRGLLGGLGGPARDSEMMVQDQEEEEMGVPVQGQGQLRIF